ENIVSTVDGVLHVADEMGEADLIFLVRPTQLAAIAIGHPVVRPKIAEEILDHLLGPRRLGDKDGAVAVMKHPQPPVAFADPQPGFVRLQSGPGKQSGADCARTASPWAYPPAPPL